MRKLTVYILLISLISIGAGCLKEEVAREEQLPKTTRQVTSSVKKAEELTAKRKSEKASSQEKVTSSQKTDTSLVRFSVYFSDDQANYLVKENRATRVEEIVEGKSELDIRAELAMEALIKGPTQPNLYRTIPEGTKLLGLEIRDKTAYVDFSKELSEKHWGGSTGELLTIGSIVNTLTQFAGIEKVQILIEGKIEPTLAGHADISVPLARNEELIAK
jgi:germination protein M